MKPWIAIALVCLLGACTTPRPSLTATPVPTGPDPTAQVLQVDLPRQAAQALDEAPVPALVAGNQAFAFDLYQPATAADPGNMIYSPYSISLAFSLVYGGARGETEAQMAEILHFLPPETHHAAFNSLDQYLTGLGRTSETGLDPSEVFQLSIANAVWGQQDYPFEADYLAGLAQYYGAGLRAVNFTTDSEAVRQEINRWIEAQTQERIRDMVPQGMLDEQTRLVLVNAIYFKATWLYTFDESATQPGPFTLLDGSQVIVPLMHNSTARIHYLDGDGYQAALLPYRGDVIDMLVILPDPGQFEPVEAALSPDLLAQIRQSAELHDTTLIMPKFDFESQLDLKALLREMGLTAPFEAADFSGIAAGSGLAISDALHQANITVDEQGTEAAAATVIAMAESAYERAELTLDRPFIFAILDRQTGSLLFLGRVLNPAEAE